MTCFFCNFLSSVKIDYDLEIYRKVGSATYTQLCENFPSYYNEKYCEYRNNGDTLSFTHPFNFFLSRDQFVYKKGCYDLSCKRSGLPYPSETPSERSIKNINEFTFDDAVPFPPNYVSSLISELPFKKPCEIKYFIIQSLKRDDCENTIDFLREFLQNSSRTYNSPVYKYGDIFFLSVFFSFIIAFIFKKLIYFKD